MSKKLIGKITHYFDKIGVAVVESEGKLKLGDKIIIESGEDSDSFSQNISSMQVERKSVTSAKKGDSVGMKMDKPVKPNWKIYLE